MSVSTKLFKIEKYPDTFPVETEPVNPGLGDDFLLKTKVELLGKGEYKEKDLLKLLITHDKGSEFKGIGYSRDGGRIEDLISIAEEKEFPAFIFPDRNFLIAAFSSKEIFNQAFRRLSKYYSIRKEDEEKKLIARPLRIDLQKLKESYTDNTTSPKIKGGWFRDLRITNVDVAYIGGGGVEESDEWFKYETLGKISALRVDFPNSDPEAEPFRLLLTSDGSIYSYKTFIEHELLSIIVPIYEYIIQFVES